MNENMQSNVHLRDFSSEFEFHYSRSSGPGGQNVNKVSTKAELRFSIQNSIILSETEKEILIQKLSTKLTKDGILRIVSQVERTQTANKERCVEKFYVLIEKCFKTQKMRKPSKPSKKAKQNRLDEKHKNAEKKALRKNIFDD